VIVRIGDTESLPDPRIPELGFSIEHECKLLGFTVGQGEPMYEKNFDDMLIKVKKTINFWKIFNLSLPGKIMIVKSLIFPIMNYYMLILVPTSAWIAEIKNLIEKFVLQGMNVSKDKLYSSPEEGGLGLFALDTFLRPSSAAG
jgi:hypothetical protein